ncbi:hypothetical protein [uncultured Tistrella sp.]|uniref:hypothetical protein n=1 Tax=Tistrella mobilis TaxID=171437 RepID=UPI002611DEC6|nr:hypothetical protein [uncultured Tistrella sp.]|tara:strand:+ start:259 stop:993 length:735 start_codon:yes stop_codon:yes gene_type:complete
MESKNSYIDELIKIVPVVILGCYLSYIFGFFLAVDPKYLISIRAFGDGGLSVAASMILLIIFSLRYSFYKNSELEIIDIDARKLEARSRCERFYIWVCAVFGQRYFLSRRNHYYISEMYFEVFLIAMVSIGYSQIEPDHEISCKILIATLIISFFFLVITLFASILFNNFDQKSKLKIKIFTAPIMFSAFLGVILSSPSDMYCEVADGTDLIFSGRAHIMPNLLIGTKDGKMLRITLDSKTLKC